MSAERGGDETMTLGPVQMLVVGFETDDRLRGEALAELKRLSEHDIVRLIDLLAVREERPRRGRRLAAHRPHRGGSRGVRRRRRRLNGLGAGGEEGAYEGAIAGAAELEGGHVFKDHEVWCLQDAIPNGSAAAIALLEHRWAIPLRDAILRAGGMTVADEWIHPADLVAVGLKAAEEAELEAPRR